MRLKPEALKLAKCRTLNIDMFPVPTDGLSQDEIEDRIANEVCNSGVGCPIKELCLEMAIANREPSGVWGGLSTAGRRRYARTQLKRRIS